MLFVFTLFITLYVYLKEQSSKTLLTWNIFCKQLSFSASRLLLKGKQESQMEGLG